MKNGLYLTILLLPCFAQQSVTSANNSVSGKISGDNGTPVARAAVSLHLVSLSLPRRHDRTQWLERSGIDGAFQFDGLIDGVYTFCAQTGGKVWLDPCEWGLSVPSVSLSSARPKATVNIVLKRGALVTIRIDDPSNLLRQHEGKSPGAHLLIGYASGGFAFRPAIPISEDQAGRNHQILIPFDRSVNLLVSSSFFRLNNGAGVALPMKGPSMPVTVQTGQQPPSIRLTVVSGGGQ